MYLNFVMLPIRHDIFDVRDILISAAKFLSICYKKALGAPPSNSSRQDSRPSRFSRKAGQIHQVSPKSCAEINGTRNLCGY